MLLSSTTIACTSVKKRKRLDDDFRFLPIQSTLITIINTYIRISRFISQNATTASVVKTFVINERQVDKYSDLVNERKKYLDKSSR